MCFELDSVPPIPVVRGAAVSHEDLVLEAADGNRLAAFLATPEQPSRAGVVVLPDVRGLYRFYEEVALRFAERGCDAVAIDYFGRTAGTDKRPADFDFEPHVAGVTAEQIQLDIGAALRHVQGCPTRFTVGFCFGGRQSWLAASAGHGIDGAVGFYGFPGQHPLVPGDGPTLRAAQTRAPILALQAGDDPLIPAALNEEYDAALTAAGVEHELVTYEGAPHSFFDKHHAAFAAASEDAWERTLAFIELHTSRKRGTG